jgi:hypothetical protein
MDGNMISICYDTLNCLDFRITNGKLALYEGVPHFKTGIPSTKYKQITGYYNECKCEWCSEIYLKKDKIRHKCCSKECKKNLAAWNKEWKYKEKRIRGRYSKANRKYQGELTKKKKKEKTERYFELLKKTNIGPLYDNYTEILTPYYENRRAPDDDDFIEVKCAYCNKWFKPSKSQMHKILPFINGNSTKKYSTTFYCCTEHAILLKKKLTKIKKEWELNKKLEEIAEELLLLPEITQKRKYFKKNFVGNKERIKYFNKIKGSFKVKKEPKMPTDPNERYLYEIERNKKYLNNMKKENPRKFKIRRLMYYSKVRAKEKNIEHTITKEWLKEKLKEDKCELTKLPFNYNLDIPRNPFGPSIDRIDITKGYTPENCRLVLWAVNTGLGHYTEKDLYTICKAYLLKHNLLN